jgi:O-antigen/teichoic acid export membrane protein
MRFGAFASVGVTVLFYILTDATIQFLFKVNSPEISLICKVFLISQFVTCAIRGVPSRYLLMSGRHKFVAYCTAAEAAANIALSIFLCYRMGIMGVVWGTLIPNVIISLFVMLPPAVRALNFDVRELILIFLKPALAIIIPALICEYAISKFGVSISDFAPLLFTYFAAGSAYLALSWFFVITHAEREMMLSKIPFLKKFLCRKSA